MILTLDELRDMILPMIQSPGERTPEEMTDAIIEIIKQDRQAHDTAG